MTWKLHSASIARSISTALLGAALLAAARPASADPAPADAKAPGTAAPAVAAPAPSEAPVDRTDPAQYRGRTNLTTAGEALAWIPRALLFPVFLGTEYGFRRPIYAGAEWVDEHHVVPLIDRALHPFPGFYWSPTFSLDLGAVTFLGAQARWKDLGVPGHEVRIVAEAGIPTMGGEEGLHFKLQDRWPIGRGVYAGARGEYLSRPDRAFFGFGPRSGNVRTNFTLARREAFAFAGYETDNHLRLELTGGFRSDRTSNGSSPRIDLLLAPADIPGFGEISLGMAMLDVTLDSRRVREENSGFRVLGDLTYARDVRDPERSFLSAELDAEGAVEVSAPDRVLALRAYAMDTFALGREPVPFTHQAMLGWENHYGFVWGRFRGESALLAQLQYRYPIAYFVDAQWTASVGNVFDARFSDFTPGALTGSIGVGLRTRRTGHAALQLTFALGTSRFDEPFGFNNVRVFLGTAEGL